MRRNSTKPRQQPTSTPAAPASTPTSAGGFHAITTAVKMVSTRLASSTSSSEEMDDGGLNLELPQSPYNPQPTPHQPVTVITRLAVARNYDQQVLFTSTTPLPQSHPVTVITRLAVARQTLPSSSMSKIVKANNVIEEVEPTHVLDLPQEILCKIFSYLDFKEVGQIRLVSCSILFLMCLFLGVINYSNEGKPAAPSSRTIILFCLRCSACSISIIAGRMLFIHSERYVRGCSRMLLSWQHGI